MNSKVANWEIATYILFTLGGVAKRISTEDIAIACYRAAPKVFSWVRYPEYPDKDIVRSALMDARKEKNGGLVNGRSGRGKGKSTSAVETRGADGWVLTENGIAWVKTQEIRIAKFVGKRELSSQRQEREKRLNRIRTHPIYQTFIDEGSKFQPSIGEMAELFQCRVDAAQPTWDKRFSAVSSLALAADDQNIFRFVEMCKSALSAQIHTE